MKNNLLVAISIIAFVFVFFIVISIIENPKSDVVQNNEIIQNETRLSIDEQSKDDKGIFIPLSEGAGIMVDDVSLSQIFVRNPNIEVYYIDLSTYPQFKYNIISYSEKLADLLSSMKPNNKSVNIFVFSEMKDLYYLRDLPQTVKDTELELMRLKPLVHIDYQPSTTMGLCYKAGDNYISIGKTTFNNWEWEEGLACDYQHIKAMYQYWDNLAAKRRKLNDINN